MGAVGAGATVVVALSFPNVKPKDCVVDVEDGTETEGETVEGVGSAFVVVVTEVNKMTVEGEGDTTGGVTTVGRTGALVPQAVTVTVETTVETRVTVTKPSVPRATVGVTMGAGDEVLGTATTVEGVIEDNVWSGGLAVIVTAGAVEMASAGAEVTAPDGETGTEEKPMTWIGGTCRR
jgi:hypothetical protein